MTSQTTTRANNFQDFASGARVRPRARRKAPLNLEMGQSAEGGLAKEEGLSPPRGVLVMPTFAGVSVWGGGDDDADGIMRLDRYRYLLACRTLT
jgi:hypothetical protein